MRKTIKLMNEIKDEFNKWRDIPHLRNVEEASTLSSSSQIDLQIQCNPNQNARKLFY
jgi:hypothetical protein